MNKLPINKKEVLAKLKKRLKESGATQEELRALNMRFDAMVKLLQERLSTQLLTKVETEVVVSNLEKEFAALRKTGLPITNLKDYPTTLNIDKIAKPAWYKEAPDKVDIKSMPAVAIEGTVKVEQDQTGLMAFMAEALGTLITFFGKLAKGTFTVKKDEGDFLKPQIVMLYNPYTKQLIDPDKMFTVINGGTPSISISSGGSASRPADRTLVGQKRVTTAGTRVQLGTGACTSVTIKALLANTGKIYVGDSAVSSTTGFELGAGDSVSVDVSALDNIYIDSSVNGEGVSFVYIR